MRKVKALVTIKDYRICHITAIDKHGLTHLVRYTADDMHLAKQYSNLRDIITSVLNILDNNNMYVDYNICFNSLFPEIFITKLDSYSDMEFVIPEQYGYIPYKFRQPGLNKRGEKYYIEKDKVYRV